MGGLFTGTRTAEHVLVAPGATWLRAWLTLDQQQQLAAECRAIIEGPVGGYVPTVRGGGMVIPAPGNGKKLRISVTRSVVPAVSPKT